MTHPMLKRTQAVDACSKRFLNAPLKWGSTDCVKLAALAMRKQGHTVTPLKGVRYRSKTSALKAFKASGFDSLVAGVDATGLTRIAPAMTLPGDLIALRTPDDDPFGASVGVVHTGAARRLITLDGEGTFRVTVPDLDYVVAAWRV